MKAWVDVFFVPCHAKGGQRWTCNVRMRDHLMIATNLNAHATLQGRYKASRVDTTIVQRSNSRCECIDASPFRSWARAHLEPQPLCCQCVKSCNDAYQVPNRAPQQPPSDTVQENTCMDRSHANFRASSSDPGLANVLVLMSPDVAQGHICRYGYKNP